MKTDEPGIAADAPTMVTVSPGTLYVVAADADGELARAVATVASGHPGLVTVGVRVRRGQFELGFPDGSGALTDGAGLAAALVTLPLYQVDVRFWLGWPQARVDRSRLRTNLNQFAEATGATVWAPVDPSQVVLLEGCLDLGAVTPDGQPARWERFGRSTAFDADGDGRLVPAAGIPGSTVSNESGVFGGDLDALPDGRLAVRYSDGSRLAVGPRQFADLLRAAGWSGGPVSLRASPGGPVGSTHLSVLSTYLGAPITLTGTAGPEPPVQVPGPPTDDAGQTESAPGAWSPSGPSRFLDGPRLETAAPGQHHGIAWLPVRPQTNAEAFELFVPCPIDPGAAFVHGVPSPVLFLVGRLDRDRLAVDTSASHLLRIAVAPGGAVDPVASEATPPAVFTDWLTPGDAYVLPARWLDRCRVIASFRVVPGREPVPQGRVDRLPVLLAPQGAAHGVDGLPAEAPRWPQYRRRSLVTCYLVIPRDATLGPWCALFTDRPSPRGDEWLLAVGVAREQAIDVVAANELLAGLPAVRSSAPRLLERGVTLILPANGYGGTIVDRIWRARGDDWVPVVDRHPVPLGDWARRVAGTS
jgi:hypothetical protein